MDYNKLIEEENKPKVEKVLNEEDWRFINLKDTVGIQLYAECIRLDMKDEEEEELEKKCENIQKWRNSEWIKDREYRKSMGEIFYECNNFY